MDLSGRGVPQNRAKQSQFSPHPRWTCRRGEASHLRAGPPFLAAPFPIRKTGRQTVRLSHEWDCRYGPLSILGESPVRTHFTPLGKAFHRNRKSMPKKQLRLETTRTDASAYILAWRLLIEDVFAAVPLRRNTSLVLEDGSLIEGCRRR